MPTQNSSQLSRRQFSRLVAASTAVLLCQDAQAETTARQTTPAISAADEARIARIEKEHGFPLTIEQRRKLPAALKDLDETTALLRKTVVPDGGSEPATAFSPLRPVRQTKKGV